MSRRVLIIDDSCDARRLAEAELEAYSDLVTLCWLAPATVERLRRLGGVRCHGLFDVVGSLERWERRAIARMERVCKAGDRDRGLAWRSLVAEPLYREALVVQALVDADRLRRRLAGDDPAAFDLRLTAESERLFRELAEAPNRSPPPPPPALTTRLARRLRHVLLSRDFRGQLWNLADQLDATYRLRSAVRRRPDLKPGGVTFFSSYLNNSRVLRIVEPHVPGPVRWVVTNYYARAGAAGHRGSLHWLWSFAPEGAAEPVDGALESPIGGGAEGQVLDAWLAGSPTWSYWRRSGRFSLPRLTAFWESYLERARPRLVAVASQWGLEGWLAGIARRRGIPVLLLLHGILEGEFYTRQPIAADAFVVWGEFWRQLWPESERSRIHVWNPPSGYRAVARQPPAGPPRVTFFSLPIDRVPFFPRADLEQGFIELFHRLLSAGACRLTVRAHPLENPADLIGRWRRLHGDLPPGVRLSQRQPLAEVLADTDVAIMFRSTVMLDCFASGIPLIIPRWLEFNWQERLEGVRGVHLAADFDDLRRTLDAWLRDPPRMDRDQTRTFLQPASADGKELTRFLSGLLAGAEA